MLRFSTLQLVDRTLANAGADLRGGGGVDRVSSHPLRDWATKIMLAASSFFIDN